MKVTGLNILATMVEDIEMEKKVAKARRKERIKKLTDQGIDKTIATAMVDAGISCGIYEEEDADDFIGTFEIA